jgi:ArsR family transcriptional regulator, arsenate/arsenite/antimonite-responsive transcriptional repressor
MNININDYLKQISDQTRLRSLILLHKEGELCVCELTYALALSQPKVSRHLGVLREMGIVQGRRDGLWIYYSLHRDLPDWALSILESAAQGAEGVEPFASDETSIRSMPNRPGAACCA